MQCNLRSILSKAYVYTESEGQYMISYASTEPSPFFESHPLFLDPIARHCNEEILTAIFQKSKDVIILSSNTRKDLIDIPALFEESWIFPYEMGAENFAIRNGRLVMARPWLLGNDPGCPQLSSAQE
jgi:hypothetical protein